MEAASYILFFITSEEVMEGIKAMALLFFISYPIAQGLIMYNTNANRKIVERMQREQMIRDKYNEQLPGMRKSNMAAPKGKTEDSGGAATTYLTNEQRELGKKLIEEARSAGH